MSLPEQSEATAPAALPLPELEHLTPPATAPGPEPASAPGPEATPLPPLPPEPTPAPAALPPTEAPKDWICPACGKGNHPWRSKLVAHVKAAHRDKAEEIIAAIPKGPAPGTKSKATDFTAPETPAPDFSDIDGSNGNGTAASAPAPGAPPTPGQVIDFTASAALSFDMGTSTLAMIFGKEWHPQNDKERQVMIEAIANYYRSIGLQDIPPGMMLVIMTMAYSAPRMAQPSTKGKLVLAWLWLKSKFTRKRTVVEKIIKP